MPWPCPTCRQVALRVAQGTVHVHEGKESVDSTYHDDWAPEWIERRFICMLTCACGEWVAVAGEQHVEEAFFESGLSEANIQCLDVSVPLLFHPPLQIIVMSDRVPGEVREQLERSFAAFWIDLESCANRIRASIEKLLDVSGVKRMAIQSGKRLPLTLHKRIQISASRDYAFADELMAIKWLGNAGAHSAAITRDDIFDAYEIIEHVLSETYDAPRKRIARIVKTINKAKKPRSATPRTKRRT